MNHSVPLPWDVRLMNAATWLLLLACVLLGAVTGLRWLAHWHVFNISSITVRGDTAHNNAATLRANVAAHVKGTLFTTDLAEVRSALEATPWVRKALVRRTFPNHLEVALEEHRAVAFWDGRAGMQLLNEFGEVFDANINDLEQNDMPLLSGPDGQSQEVLTMYRALADLFSGIDLPIAELQLSDRGSWSVRLETDATIEMGRGNPQEVGARVHRFVKTLTQIVSRYQRTTQDIESADLRHENGYAIRIRGISTTPSEAGKST